MKIEAQGPRPTAPRPPTEVPTARLVAAAGTSREAWHALGLGSVSVSVGVHAAALVDGLEPAERERIGRAVARGCALIDAHDGPIPAAWVKRMRELHREALLALWHADGAESRGRVFQVLGAIPTRWGPWLEEGIKGLDGPFLRAAGPALVGRAVAAWLGADDTTEGDD